MSSANKLTFRQREGIEPLPAPLDKENLSPELRNALWSIVYCYLQKTMRHSSISGYGNPSGLGDDWYSILKLYHCSFQHKPLDEFDDTFEVNKNSVKEIILQSEWSHVIIFLEHVIQHKKCPSNLHKGINLALAKFLYPYKIINKMFVPVSSKQEGEAIENAFTQLQENRLGGAEKHLTKSIENLKKGEYADSVRESVHAVESLVKKIIQDDKATLGEALAKLESLNVYINPSLKKGFQQIYGYTSNEKGIRHAMLDDETKVDSSDASFMLGACASFVSYLINKAHKAEITIDKEI